MLDAESEENIWKNMDQISKNRTVFIITHRLSTLKRADRIFTLEGGELIESGTPGELLSNGGRYAQLHRLQIGAVGTR